MNKSLKKKLRVVLIGFLTCSFLAVHPVEVAAATSKGDVQSVVVQKVSRNKKTDLSEFVIRTTIKKGTSAKWLAQVGGNQVTYSGVLSCKKRIGKTCYFDKKVIFTTGVKRMAFTAIPVNGGDSISIALIDPYQWDVVKAIINNGWSTGANVMYCEQKFGSMDVWKATRVDRDAFVSAYKVRKWTTVFSLALNDAGTILSFVGVTPGKNAARDLAVELVAPMIWDRVLEMPTVTARDAMAVGGITMGYKMSEYMVKKCA